MEKVKFADIGEGLTEGKVVEVLVKVGDEVQEGDSLFSVETDKVNAEIPSPVKGKIAKIFIKPDQEIKVGEVVMEIDDGKSTPDSSNSNSTESKTESAPDEPEEENASVVGSTPVSNRLLPSRGPRPATSKSTTSPPTPVRGMRAAASVKNDQEKEFKASNPQNHYQVVVIGGGIGGYVAAIRAAQLGFKTLVVEKGAYGGVCLNVGCIPTKTLLKSAKLVDQVQNKLEPFGIELGAGTKVNINWSKVQARKNDVVKKLTSGVLYLIKKNKIDHLEAEAKAIDNHTIEVNGQKYTYDDLIVATGSEPNKLPLPGFDEGRKTGFVIDSTAGLSLPKIPKKLIVIGGGVIGVEFACLYSNLGTEVTILQGLPTILEMLDQDISQEMTKLLIDKYGIKIIPNAKIESVEGNSVHYSVDGRKEKISADYCLESVGRKPVTTGFDNIGLEKTDRGYLAIKNDYCQTNLENVYAIGDVNGKVMLAHAASHEGIVAANHIASRRLKDQGHVHPVKFDEIPSCVYAHPEIASVGKTEAECQKAGLKYKTFKYPFSAIGKALADGHPYGFVKLIMDEEYGAILGAHIIGNRATEMISEITAVMQVEGTIAELSETVVPHPTMSEAIGEAAYALWTGKTLNL